MTERNVQKSHKRIIIEFSTYSLQTTQAITYLGIPITTQKDSKIIYICHHWVSKNTISKYATKKKWINKAKKVFPQCSCYLFNIRSQNSNPSRWVIGLLFWIKILYLPWLFTSGMATKVMQSRNIPGIDILQSEFLPSIKASKCHRSFKIDLFTLNF